MDKFKKLCAEIKAEKFERNDIGAAELFTQLYYRQLVYVPETAGFMYYDGARWVPDVGGMRAELLAKQFARGIRGYFNDIDNEAAEKFYSKYYSRSARKQLLEDVRSVWPKNLNEFDLRPWLFNCSNCTINMKDVVLYPSEPEKYMKAHNPMDFITKRANVDFNPLAKAPEWEKFVSEIMEGDQELIDYLQKCLGYSITGWTNHECFFLGYGPTTRNGKGTLDNTIRVLLGDYAKSADPGMFAVKKFQSDSARNLEERASLFGARYVSTYEPDEEMTLNSALIKAMTGNDSIRASMLYKSSFTYTPSYKIWFFTNHLPKITDRTVFTSDRVRIVPFNRHFEPEEQNKGLKHMLTEDYELSGILNWLLAGYYALAVEGHIRQPEKVQKLTEDYSDDDGVLDFFMNHLVFDSVSKQSMNDLKHAYHCFCAQRKEEGRRVMRPIRDSEFVKAITRLMRIDVPEHHDRACIVGWKVVNVDIGAQSEPLS